jgi:uncharacterized protein
MKALEREWQIFASLSIIDEIETVLRRDFKISEEELDEAIASIRAIATRVDRKETIVHIMEDPADDRILECAVACKADYICTGDSHLLKLKKFRNIRIVTVAEMLGS